MGYSSLHQGLSYALCALGALALVLNILLTILCLVQKHLRRESSLKYVRYSSLLLGIANIVSSIGVIMLSLWGNILDPILCEAGGFLMLFGILESIWLLLVCSVGLLIQMKSDIKVKLEGEPLGSRHRWSFPIFLLSMLLKAVIIAMLVFLSLTKIDFFKNSEYICYVVRLYDTATWEYSVVLLIISWVAVIPATIINLCNIFLYASKHYPMCKSSKLKITESHTAKEKFTHKMAIAYLTSALLWIIVLMAVTVIIVSGDDFISMEYLNMSFGYTFAVALILGTGTTVAVLIITRKANRRRHQSNEMDKDMLLQEEPPNTLVSLSKLPQNKDELRRYQVQWMNHGQLTTGVMKVFHPACVSRWHAEVNAVAKLSPSKHVNIAQYLWHTNKNRFAPAICSSTGDLLSPESSVLCMMNYPHGTLGNYLKTRNHMTELGLHQVTLDIARGLGFIHQHHLVHNGLTTDTIYMASISGKIGLRAVIGDFESSHQVSENTLRKSPLTFERPSMIDHCSFGSLYSISQQLDLDNNKFAPDIRSFGMIVLEMLIALGEFEEHSGIGIHYRSKDVRRNSTYDNTSLTSSLGQLPVVRKQVILPTSRHLDSVNSDPGVINDNHHHHKGTNKRCTCSPRVTDIRVRSRSTDNTPIHIVDITENQMGSLPSGNKSAFASIKALKENTSTSDSKCSGHHQDTRQTGTTSSRNVREIQKRDLPPLPPRNSNSAKSPRRHRSYRQSYDGTHSEGHNLSPQSSEPLSSPNCGSSTPSSMQLDELSSDATDLSPSSDADFYSLSVGSLGSFETIYEDEEKGTTAESQNTNHSQSSTMTKNGHRYTAAKPPVFKRKPHDEAAQRKRFSVASNNDSVFSTDSGVGSYLSDAYSEMSAQVYSQRLWREAPKGTKEMQCLDAPALLRVRKQPCSKHHPEPGHICASDPGLQTDSSPSNSDTMSSEEPTYESIGKHATHITKVENQKSDLSNKARNSLRMSSTDNLRIPMKDLVTGAPHPVIRQQYRAPRLGISAVLNRRLSDASLSSLNSCSTYRSQELSQSATDLKIHRSSQNISVSRASLAKPVRQSDEMRIQVNSPDGNNSLSSSIMSIIQDNKTLLDIASEKGKLPKNVSRHSGDFSQNPSRFSKSNSSSKTSVTKNQLNQYNELTKLSNMLDLVRLEPKEKNKMINMLKLVSSNDRLGFIGHQMMSLFSDCWLEDPVPSADEILQRLNLVLPTASV